MRDTARMTFPFSKIHGLDSESWRVVTWRNRWKFGYTRPLVKFSVTCSV